MRVSASQANIRRRLADLRAGSVSSLTSAVGFVIIQASLVIEPQVRRSLPDSPIESKTFPLPFATVNPRRGLK